MTQSELLKYFTDYEKIITLSLEDPIKNPDSNDFEIFNKFEKYFYDDIYYERIFIEQLIQSNILDGVKVISVEGTTGCGKSSITRRVLKDLHYQSFVPEIFNFNKIYNKNEFPRAKNNSEWQLAISNEIKKRLLAKYFINNEKYLDSMYEYCFFLDVSEIKEDFSRERLILEATYKKNGNDEETLLEFYKKNINIDKIQQLHIEIIEKIRYTHLIVILKYLKHFNNKFIIVLDNVDRIPRQYQPFCYEFAVGFFFELRDYAQIIICIRHENAHRAKDVPSEKSEFVIPIKLVNLAPHQPEYNYLTPEGFNQILSRRQKFYENNRTKNDFTKLISQLTNSIRNRYLEYDLIDLSNQSIRTALEYHCKFLFYIIKNVDLKYLLNVLEYKGSRILNSIFLAWIADTSEVLELQSLNIVGALQDSEIKHYNRHGCDLSYLVIVYLLNQLHKSQAPEMLSIKLEKIYRELEVIGFSLGDVKHVLYGLFNFKNTEFSHIISIENDEIVEDETSLTLESKISINYRGKCLIENITSTFTYLNRLIINTDPSYYKEYNPTNYFELSNYKYHFINNIRFFSRIAFVHYLELVRIAKKIGSDDWLKYYRNRFCLEYKFQLTRIIDRNRKFISKLLDYYSTDKESILRSLEILNKLDQIYLEEVEKITPNIDKVFDFKTFIYDYIKGEVTNTSADVTKSKYYIHIGKYID